MSAGTAAAAGPPAEKKSGGLSTKAKVLIGLGTYLAIAILLGLIFGSDGKNEAFQPQNEFKLEPWVSIELGGIDLSINKAVFYLLLASALTIAAMTWIAKRMAQKPNRVQTAVEVAYDLTKNNITGGNLDGEDGVPLVPLPRHPLLLHLVLEHHRLPAAADQHRAHDQHPRRRDSLVRPLRRHREPLDLARPDAGGLVRVPRRRGSGQGFLRVPGELAAARSRGHEPGSRRGSSS